MIKIKHQSSKPTCTPFVLSSILEYHYNVIFSTDFIYGLRDNEQYSGEGMLLVDGLRVIKTIGDVPYTDLPGNSYYKRAAKKVQKDEERLKALAEPYRIKDYYRVKTIKDIKDALAADGPLAADLKFYKKHKVKQGVLTYISSDKFFRHAVLIVGWNEKGLIIQNSWGRFWGKQGRCTVLYEDFKLFGEIYGVKI